ncbi:hypothetical protein BpHYR1_007837 [Brachionus plicatilis]|uniref:Uncharacterized protein n=1 Tax=Brachionus plicatilis TaxID=10195 RepID=A0A3M7S5U5_BRAPC|nr:hypothetical protein BpHYR1_007837 [Brachionus plicatilis]
MCEKHKNWIDYFRNSTYGKAMQLRLNATSRAPSVNTNELVSLLVWLVIVAVILVKEDSAFVFESLRMKVFIFSTIVLIIAVEFVPISWQSNKQASRITSSGKFSSTALISIFEHSESHSKFSFLIPAFIWSCKRQPSYKYPVLCE